MTGTEPIVALFSDGGVVRSNPSTMAGTWSWCAVSANGEHVREVGAYLLPRNSTYSGHPRLIVDHVTNNDTEFWAAMRALESMPDGWSGYLATDSMVTIERLKKCRDRQAVPANLWIDMFGRARDALKRLGEVKIVHVAGHPTQAELLAGYRQNPDGTKTRVSRHQKWCDDECTRLAKAFDEYMSDWEQIELLSQSEDPVSVGDGR